MIVYLIVRVAGAMKAMTNDKAYGVDRLPAEVLKSGCITDLLTVLFDKCFSAGIPPTYGNMKLFSPFRKHRRRMQGMLWAIGE